MTDKIRIYFMGSGRIALPVLAALLSSEKIFLLGIGTQADQPAGRKKQLTPTPVGCYAAANRLDADKIETVKDAAFTEKLRTLNPDFIVVVSFGQILRQELLGIPGHCCLNVHASLLPKYRGASPIAAAILNGDAETGITFMRMNEGLDTGDIYKLCRNPLQGDEDAYLLEYKLGELAAENIVETLERIKNGTLIPVQQDESQATLTRKIKKNDGKICWRLPAEKIYAMVRAYHPWPGAYFFLPGGKMEKKIIVTEARCIHGASGKSGEILRADKKKLIIGCGEGALEIVKLLPQGKKEMSGPAFLNGHPLSAGSIISA